MERIKMEQKKDKTLAEGLIEELKALNTRLGFLESTVRHINDRPDAIEVEQGMLGGFRKVIKLHFDAGDKSSWEKAFTQLDLAMMNLQGSYPSKPKQNGSGD